MEEVDGIIITTLKGLGCKLDDDAVSLHHFTPAMMVEACVRCLRVINSNFSSPTSLPEAMSAKYRMCSTLASACQELGYQAEIGYQTFLYANIKDWRKLLMFMLEKLPREEATATDEPMGSMALLNRTIAAKLQAMLITPWMPPLSCSHKLPAGNRSQWATQTGRYRHGFHAVDVQAPNGAADLTQRIPKDVKHFYARYLPYVVSQPPVRDDLMASMLERNTVEVSAQQEWEAEWNQAGLASRLSEQDYRARKRQKLQKRIAEQLRQGIQIAQQSKQLRTTGGFEEFLAGFAGGSAFAQGKGSRFQHTEKLQFTKEDEATAVVPDGPSKPSEEELAQQREQEINDLQEELGQLVDQIEGMQLDIKKFSSNMQQIKETTVTMDTESADMETEYQTQKKTFDLLPNADENIEKLQALVGSSTERLSKVAAQWEEHRAPLIERYRVLKEQDSQLTAQTTDLLEEIKIVRERMKEVAEEARLKDDLYKQLVAEYERMSKDLNRSAYTKRIMEIVGNIRKQKADIDKVLMDTRQVQKEINQLSGKLERIFLVTEEQIYKDAKKDEARRTAYKYLASLRENCKLVEEAIKETGQIKREIKELDEQIETETGKRIAANLEKITADYDQVKKENAQLIAQLKT